MKCVWLVRSLSRPFRGRMPASGVEGLERRSYLAGVAFGAAVNTSTASAQISPVYVDLDNVNARDADLVTANSNNSVSILQGKADGTFGPAATFPLDFSAVSVQVGVLAGGLADIVVGSATSNVFGVILQTYGAIFNGAQDYITGLANTKSIMIGDFNGDGKPDIAIASDDSGTSNNVAIFLNNGSGGFTQSQLLSVPHADLSSMTAYTAGSTTDLAVADLADNEVTTLTNDGSGHFSLGNNYPVGPDPVSITHGLFDFGSDNYDDLVTADAAGGSVSVLPGNGDGTFRSAVNSAVDGTLSGGGPLTVSIADLNPGDPTEYSDLVCLLSPGSSGDAETLLGSGDGTFQVGGIVSTGGGTRTGIGVGDLNGDGLTDLVLSNQNQVTSLVDVTSESGLGPTAYVASARPSVSAGAATIQFNVTYSDAVQVEADTLGNGNLTVTEPSGITVAATLVSTSFTPSATVTATYSIPVSSGSASPADDGAYSVTASSNSVMNIGGYALAGGPVGQFTVAVPLNQGPNLEMGVVTVNNPASAIVGTRFAGPTRVTVVNTGDQTAKGRIVIDLYASSSETVPSGTPAVASVMRSINLKPGGKVVEELPGFKWPSTPGSYFIVARADATQTIAETNLTDDLGISGKSTIVATPFVEIDNRWSGKLPATLKAGRRRPLAVTLENLGNTAARGTATYTVQAEGPNDSLTIIGTGSVRVAAAATRQTTVSIPVTVPAALASGSYRIVITVSYPGDPNPNNDSATSANAVSV